MADENDKLSKVFDEEVCKELKKASNHVTRQCIVMRVLLRCFKIAGYTLDDMIDYKSQIRVHMDCKAVIEQLWIQAGRKNVPTQDETNTFERFMSKDFFRPWDLGKLITILSKKYSREDLNSLLAVDGFAGEELKNYIGNLRYGFSTLDDPDDSDYKAVHVRAIRRLYDEYKDLSVERLNRMLFYILDGGKSLFREDPDLCESYRKYIGDHLTKIQVWKQEQKQKEKQQREKKSNESKKRKLVVVETKEVVAAAAAVERGEGEGEGEEDEEEEKEEEKEDPCLKKFRES
ncbi:hypothetical protein RF55_16323 [Lasius niger]|uniref:Uncharacterized protein n=1 Tax=Lasius niger TaxID=67767 RepID=A0A0J7K4L2_LASNI|nr:hypothetical protein RF55_16323 [Lasius niger]